MAGSTVIVSILADTKKFTEGFADAGKKTSLLTKGLAAGAIAAGAAVAAVGAFAAKAVQAAGESQVVAAQTTAVLKSTGEAAGRSAQQISDLATKLSRVSGVDDEVVQSAENMLLTFTQIKGTQFDQATASALDMAQALGTDASSAAQQLGKALNDPVAGVTKLQKVGVTFTDEQKAQIDNYAKMGDLADAQGVILTEINKEFGGSAAAFGSTWEGAIAKFKTSWGNVLETIGGALLPPLTAGLNLITNGLNAIQDNPAFATIIQQVSGFVTSLLSGNSGISSFGAQIVKLAGFFSPLGLIIKVIQPLIPMLISGFKQIGSALSGSLMSALPQVNAALSSIAGVLSGALAQILPTIVTVVVQLATVLGKVLAAALPVVASLITTLAGVFAALMPVIVQVVTALGSTLTAVMPTLVSLFGTLSTTLSGVFAAVLPVIVTLLGAVSQIFAALLPVLTPIITAVLQIVQAFLPLVTVIAQLVGSILTPLIQLIAALLVPILALIQPLVGLLAPALTVVAQVLANVIGFVVQVVAAFVGLVTGSRAAGNGVVSAWNGVLSFFAGIGKTIAGAFSGAASWLAGIGKNIVDGLWNGLKKAWSGMLGLFGGLVNLLPAAIKKILGIHSPSLVFAGIGKNVVAGLEKGLSGSNNLSSIMGGIASNLTGSFNTTLAVPNVNGSGTTAKAAAPGPTMNVNVIQNYPTTKDPIKKLKEDALNAAAGIWA